MANRPPTLLFQEPQRLGGTSFDCLPATWSFLFSPRAEPDVINDSPTINPSSIPS